MRRFRLAGMVGAAMTGVLLGGYLLVSLQAQPAARSDQVEQPFVTDIVQKSVVTGTIVPEQEVSLKSQVPGVVEQLYVEEGQQVRTGDRIAKIRLIPNPLELTEAEFDLKVAKLNLQQAEQELRRRRKLLEQRFLPKEEYQQYLTAYHRAREQLATAEDRYELVKEGASVRAGKTSNIVWATLDGMVLDVPVEEGTFVIETNAFNEGTTIATVADMNDVIFRGLVSEADVGRLRPGMELTLTIGALQQTPMTARLRLISPKGTEDQGTMKFEIEAPIQMDDAVLLRAGYSAAAEFVFAERHDVLAIHERILKFDGETAFVEVETAPNQFERRDVVTGLSDGLVIEIPSGLTSEDRVRVPPASPPS